MHLVLFYTCIFHPPPKMRIELESHQDPVKWQDSLLTVFLEEYAAVCSDRFCPFFERVLSGWHAYFFSHFSPAVHSSCDPKTHVAHNNETSFFRCLTVKQCVLPPLIKDYNKHDCGVVSSGSWIGSVLSESTLAFCALFWHTLLITLCYQTLFLKQGAALLNGSEQATLRPWYQAFWASYGWLCHL